MVAGPAAPGAVARRVRVTAPARLHLGFLDLHGGLGRRFGSLGLTLDGIATRLTVARADATSVTGVGETRRAARVAGALGQALGLPPVAAAIEEAIPAHAGLGSGTQLALALGVAAGHLAGRPLEPRAVARALERGARSGIGIGAFEQGGFLLDGGRAEDGEPPPVVARLPFPDAWRLLLVLDPDREGLHGAGETGAFRSLPPFPEALAGELCRRVVMQLLPGLATADLAAVGAAVAEIQRRVGDHFAPAQGGRFTSPAVAEVLAWLESAGVTGIGQSSWGPTGFAFLGDEGTAKELRRAAERRFAERHPSLRLLLARGRNTGAVVEELG